MGLIKKVHRHHYVWFFCLLVFVGCVQKDKTPKSLTIVYTSNVLGEIEPCGCVYRPMGGLARKKKLIDQERVQNKALLVLDSGDLLFSAPVAPEHLKKQWKAQANFIVEQFNLIGTDAVSIGELDFSLGIDALEELQSKSQFSWVNANLVNPQTKRPLFTPFVVKQVGGLKVGIFGLTGIAPANLALLDPQETARQMVQALSKKSDFIILLSHQGWAKDSELAKNVLGIDVIVSGHDPTKTEEALRVGNTTIVHGYEKGRYAGVLNLNFKEHTVKNRLVALDSVFLDGDPKIYKNIQLFKETIAGLSQEEKNIPIPKSGEKRPSGNRIVYATYAQCKECHVKQYDVWKNSKHASAIIPLYIRNQHLNPECISCHSVGYREPGGFTDVAHPFLGKDGSKKSIEDFLSKLFNQELPSAVKKDLAVAKAFQEKKIKGAMFDLRDHPEFDQWIRKEYVGAVEKEKFSKNFLGNQCENCHGVKGVLSPTKKWIPHVTEGGFLKKVSENRCTVCHTKDQSPHFQFSKDRRIKGDSDGRAPFQCALGLFD